MSDHDPAPDEPVAGAWPGDAVVAPATGGPAEPAPDTGPEPAPDGDSGRAPALEPDAGPEVAADAGPEVAADAGPEATSRHRDAGLRLARLHLRMGSLSLARAELEAAAGRGALDVPSLVDLAEVRWRTGDLAGAGEAAHAVIDQGVDDPLAYVIAAESVAALGRPAEARRLADAAVERMDTTLDALFAGMPRAMVWPAGVEPASPAEPGRAHDRQGDPAPAPTAAAEAFAGGRSALIAGEVSLAALRLSLALRLEPGFAPGVLAAIGERGSVPLLALVAGDALRVLGREDEAMESYERARQRIDLAVPGVPDERAVPPTATGDDEQEA